LTPPVAKPLRVVLLGPPASGKGTQGKRLAESLGLGYLGTGMLLRQQMAMGSDLGKQAAPILARGEYLPDDLMCPILADWLSDQSGGWVLDGFPRSLQQAIFLDNWLARWDLRLDVAVSLKVSFDEILARIRNRIECSGCHWTGHCGLLSVAGKCPVCGGATDRRADDDDNNFRSRHAEFVSLTQPVIAHYRQLGLLYSCDATLPQDEVASLLLEKFIHPSLF
jgi:adenylate kinase